MFLFICGTRQGMRKEKLEIYIAMYSFGSNEKLCRDQCTLLMLDRNTINVCRRTSHHIS